MVRQRASLILLEILGGLFLLALVVVGLVIFRLSSGPIELDLFKHEIEYALTETRDGRPVTLEQVYLEWSAEDRRVLITGNNLRLIDDQGSIAAEAKRANIVLSGSSLFFGNVEVLGLALQDGWINVDYVGEGKWKVAGDPMPEIPAGTLPQTPAEWLDRANTVLPVLLNVLQEAQDTISLERISFENFEMRLRDQGGGPILQLADSQGVLARSEDGLSLSVSGGGIGEGLPAGLAIDIETDTVNSHMKAEMAVVKWPLADMASRFGFKDASLSGLPTDITIRINTSGAVGVEDISLQANLAEGSFPFGSTSADVSDLDLLLSYSAAEDQIHLTGTTSRAGPLAGQFDILLKDALKSEGPRPFELKSTELDIDLTPTFEAPIKVTDVLASGHVDFASRHLIETSLKFLSNEAVFNLALDVVPTPDKQEGEPPVLGTIELQTEGRVAKDTILAFWPVSLGTGARNFTATRIGNATATDISGRIDLQRDSFAEGYLRNSDLNLTFNVSDANVRFLDDLPAVENATGKGRLTGNSFRVIVDTADYGGWVVDEGLVDFPAFNPRGEDFRVFAKGHGPATNIIKTLNESRLQIDFDATRVSGQSEATFELFRPALDNVPSEDVRFTAIGSLSDGGLKGAALGLDLTNASAKIDVNQAGMVLSGFGDLGPSPVEFTWRDAFADDDAPSALSASAVINPDVLNRFGLPGRAYLTGEVPVEVEASVSGESVSVANAALDLTNARIDLSEIGWIKPAGKQGKASVLYTAEDEGFSSEVLFSSDDAYLDGKFSLGTDFRLISAELRRAYLEDTADVKGSVGRDKDGTLNVGLTGTYLDMSGALPGLGAIGSGGDANGASMRVNANVDTLTLRPGLFVRDADVEWFSSSKGIQSFLAKGKTDDGSSFEADFDASGADGPDVRILSGDAGFFASAFLGLDFMEGGKLELNGQLPSNGKPAELGIVITDGRLVNAPFLTQILSLASLRGLADTLGGEGVLFSRIEIPLTLSGDRYVIKGGQAQGPALGLTANGFLQANTGEIGFDGVLVPSFGMNSALGGIPIIGDLVVGRDGEGVFSLTYSVRGTLEKANVSVNPLSALAPGVIRRIFENPTTTKIPEAKPRPAEEPIPSELAPIPEEEF